MIVFRSVKHLVLRQCIIIAIKNGMASLLLTYFLALLSILY
jgi:hypothetical protein